MLFLNLLRHIPKFYVKIWQKLDKLNLIVQISKEKILLHIEAKFKNKKKIFIDQKKTMRIIFMPIIFKMANLKKLEKKRYLNLNNNYLNLKVHYGNLV